MMLVNPLVADAMKRAGEQVPATGIIAMSNGTPIDCALSWPTTFKFQNAKMAKEFRDKLGSSEFLSGTWDGRETVKVKAANDVQLRKAREIAKSIDPGSVKASAAASIACAAADPDLVKELGPLEKEIRRHIDVLQKLKMVTGRGGHVRQQAIINAADSLKSLIEIRAQ